MQPDHIGHFINKYSYSQTLLIWVYKFYTEDFIIMEVRRGLILFHRSSLFNVPGVEWNFVLFYIQCALRILVLRDPVMIEVKQMWLILFERWKLMVCALFLFLTKGKEIFSCLRIIASTGENLSKGAFFPL